MASLFGRRKAKRVGKDEPQDSQPSEDEDSGPVVRRPITNAPKKTSKLRLSFNPSNVDAQGAGEGKEDDVYIRPAIKSRHVLPNEHNVKMRDTVVSLARPSYSQNYLKELRNSTPSTPQDLSAYTSSQEEDQASSAPDVVGKFGHSRIGSSSIPSAAEIEEKKQRRARLAKEQGADDFIALEDYDSDGEFRPQRMQVSSLVQQDQEKDSRLLRDDEDIAEGFDEFVDDPGRAALSRKGKRDQEAKERAAMRELIDDAENSSEDDSEAERIQAYETAQTSHGMDGMAAHKRAVSSKPKAPKQIPPVPKMSTVLARLKREISQLEYQKTTLEKQKADIDTEKMDLVTRERTIQRLLSETGDQFQKLSHDARPTEEHDVAVAGESSRPFTERGLDSIGGMPMAMIVD